MYRNALWLSPPGTIFSVDLVNTTGPNTEPWTNGHPFCESRVIHIILFRCTSEKPQSLHQNPSAPGPIFDQNPRWSTNLKDLDPRSELAVFPHSIIGSWDGHGPGWTPFPFAGPTRTSCPIVLSNPAMFPLSSNNLLRMEEVVVTIVPVIV